MATLSVNVDHVATLRQARGGREPDPVAAAALAELNGARGIIVHLREDRRHIQDRDLRLLRQTVRTRLNLEMAADDEMVGVAVETGPYMCTLVPEKRQELTTEGGLDAAGRMDHIGRVIETLHNSGVLVSLFIDAEDRQIRAAREMKADFVEIHTGHYADAATDAEVGRLFRGIVDAVKSAAALGLRVNLGHGLDYANIWRFKGLAEVEDYSIGHAIISRAVMSGIGQAVRDMAEIVRLL
jgi:pyridoxine 5-phosphate synthase